MFGQLFINGIVLGSAYALVALGLTLMFSIMGIVNFAHGEFYMFGAYVAWSVINYITGNYTAPGLDLSYSLELDRLFRKFYLRMRLSRFQSYEFDPWSIDQSRSIFKLKTGVIF